MSPVCSFANSLPGSPLMEIEIEPHDVLIKINRSNGAKVLSIFRARGHDQLIPLDNLNLPVPYKEADTLLSLRFCFIDPWTRSILKAIMTTTD